MRVIGKGIFTLAEPVRCSVPLSHSSRSGAPGCWQPITHDLWPAPALVVDTGASLAPYNHLDTGSPYAIEYVWGRQVGDNTINP